MCKCKRKKWQKDMGRYGKTQGYTPKNHSTIVPLEYVNMHHRIISNRIISTYRIISYQIILHSSSCITPPRGPKVGNHLPKHHHTLESPEIAGCDCD